MRIPAELLEKSSIFRGWCAAAPTACESHLSRCDLPFADCVACESIVFLMIRGDLPMPAAGKDCG